MAKPIPQGQNLTYGKDQLTVAEMHDNQSDARNAGHIYYFTGKPCIHGHLYPRYVKGTGCVACLRLKSSKWYHENIQPNGTPEQKQKYFNLKTVQRRYWEGHKSEILERNRKYHQENRESISAQQKEYYKQNREKILARKKENWEQNREEMQAKRREYRQKNRDRINQLQRERYRRKQLKTKAK